MHPRDKLIQFQDVGHTYTYLPTGAKFTSVTTAIHHHFPTFQADTVIDRMQRGASWSTSKYASLTREKIKADWEKNRDEAAQAGTQMHRAIELYLNEGTPLPENKECALFQEFWTNKKPTLELYRTEWIVFDEDIGLAGSIDCVLKDADGRLVIVDWKRSKIKTTNPYERGRGWFRKYEHCNFNHYSLQVNFYRYMLETKYDLVVKAMILVILHPDQESYEYYTVPRIDLRDVWSQVV